MGQHLSSNVNAPYNANTSYVLPYNDVWSEIFRLLEIVDPTLETTHNLSLVNRRLHDAITRVLWRRVTLRCHYPGEKVTSPATEREALLGACTTLERKKRTKLIRKLNLCLEHLPFFVSDSSGAHAVSIVETILRKLSDFLGLCSNLTELSIDLRDHRETFAQYLYNRARDGRYAFRLSSFTTSITIPDGILPFLTSQKALKSYNEQPVKHEEDVAPYLLTQLAGYAWALNFVRVNAACAGVLLLHCTPSELHITGESTLACRVFRGRGPFPSVEILQFVVDEFEDGVENAATLAEAFPTAKTIFLEYQLHHSDQLGDSESIASIVSKFGEIECVELCVAQNGVAHGRLANEAHASSNPFKCSHEHSVAYKERTWELEFLEGLCHVNALVSTVRVRSSSYDGLYWSRLPDERTQELLPEFQTDERDDEVVICQVMVWQADEAHFIVSRHLDPGTGYRWEAFHHCSESGESDSGYDDDDHIDIEDDDEGEGEEGEQAPMDSSSDQDKETLPLEM